MASKFKKYSLILVLSSIILESTIFAMDSNEFKSYQVSAKKIINGRLENKLENRVDFINNDSFPNELCFKVMEDFDLKDLFSFSMSCKKAWSLGACPHSHKFFIDPKVDKIIEDNGNFHYRSLISMAGMNDVGRKPSVAIGDWNIIENLCFAGALGNGDAYLLLAEMEWNNPLLVGKEFVRHSLFLQALRSKNPGTDDKWFPETSDEYNAIFLGIAQNSIKGPSNAMGMHPSSFNKIERAVNALLSINDVFFFQMSFVSNNVMAKLWNGDYDRMESKDFLPPSQRLRTKTEKNRDFCLLSDLAIHSKELGICNLGSCMDMGTSAGMYDMLMMCHSFNKVNAILTNETQIKLFLAKDRADLLMPD